MAETTAFQERVYTTLCTVPRGKVTTYGALAQALKSSPRAVGQALRCNPFAPRVPCHRVVRSDGSIGGFGGETKGKRIREKVALLLQEAVPVKNGRVQGFTERLHHW